MKITFHSSPKCVSPIWVGFFKQSMGILWLLHQLLNGMKWFLGQKNWNGSVIPSRLELDPKTSICTQTRAKSPKINFLSIFQLWHLKTTFFSPPYQFLWLSSIPKQNFFKNEKKIRFFENFQFFSKNGCCFNKMALRYQRYVTNDCFWDVSNPNNMKKYFFRNLPGYYHIIPT